MAWLRRFLLLSFSFSSIVLVAQQNAQFTQFRNQSFYHNPAVAGTLPHINLEAAVRLQWTGLEGAPSTQRIAAHLPIPKFKSGVGVQLLNETLGLYRNVNIHFSYAYHLKNGLSFGVYLGFNTRFFKGNEVILPSGSFVDNSGQNDELISDANAFSGVPDAGLGILYAKGRFKAGLAIRQLLPGSNQFKLTDQVDKQQMEGNLSLQYEINLSESLMIQPHLQFLSDFSRHQLNIGTIIDYKDGVEFGIAFRGYNNANFDALMILLGYTVTSKLKIGYSYDVGISALKNSHSGSHELVVNYRLENILPYSKGKIRYNPRFL